MAFKDYTPEEIEAIVQRYEFLANFVENMKIHYTDGGCDNEYPERCGVEAFNEIVDYCIENERTIQEENENDDEGDNDDDYEELEF